MRHDSSLLPLLTLLLLILLPFAILKSSKSKAQTTEQFVSESCYGNNRCETFVDGSGHQCAILGCTQSSGGELCDSQKCVLIPSSCGEGSHYDGPMTCGPQNQTASTSYYCASTDTIVLRSLTGPPCGPPPSPTPTAAPTPCNKEPALQMS